MIEQKTFYVCDPERAVNCNRTGCEKFHSCNTTGDVDKALLVGGEPLADISFMSEIFEEMTETGSIRAFHSANGELIAMRR